MPKSPPRKGESPFKYRSGIGRIHPTLEFRFLQAAAGRPISGVASTAEGASDRLAREDG
jgi:hypothetical protein